MDFTDGKVDDRGPAVGFDVRRVGSGSFLIVPVVFGPGVFEIRLHRDQARRIANQDDGLIS